MNELAFGNFERTSKPTILIVMKANDDDEKVSYEIVLKFSAKEGNVCILNDS